MKTPDEILNEGSVFLATDVFEKHELLHFIKAIQLDAQLPAKLSDEEVRRILNKHCSKFRQREKTLEMCFYDAITEALSLVQGGREDMEIIESMRSALHLCEAWCSANPGHGFPLQQVQDALHTENINRHAIRSAMKKD